MMATHPILNLACRSSCGKSCWKNDALSLSAVRYSFKNKTYRTKLTLASPKKIQIGDPLPAVNLYEDRPDNAIPASELYRGKKGILFAVVGAFTPGCTNMHIPDYISLYNKFKEEGFMISCVSVNDPFVMKAWAESTHAVGKIRMLADPRGEFTRALGMELDCKSLLGGIRSHKYSLVINDGIIQGINVDPDHTGLACLLCIKNMSVAAAV